MGKSLLNQLVVFGTPLASSLVMKPNLFKKSP